MESTDFFEPESPLWMLGSERLELLISFNTYKWKANTVNYNIRRPVQTCLLLDEMKRDHQTGVSSLL